MLRSFRVPALTLSVGRVRDAFTRFGMISSMSPDRYQAVLAPEQFAWLDPAS